jgi:myo-inositol-1(or 4)-monophosphatase
MKEFERKCLDVAKEAALEAGSFLKEHFYERPEVEFKGEINLITQRDRQSQEIIYNVISKHLPKHAILGEEDLETGGTGDFLWVIDPIDGTTNYAHTLPIFCVSIALLVEHKPHIGVVYNPMLDEMFWAVKGHGAFLNKTGLQVSSESDLSRSLLSTGFPYDLRESEDNNLDHFLKLIKLTQGIRRWGAAAIDISYVAAGRFDGFWEMKLYPWDTAAAVVFVEEAGGTVTDFSGGPFDPFQKEVLATNGKIHPQMVEILSVKNAIS